MAVNSEEFAADISYVQSGKGTKLDPPKRRPPVTSRKDAKSSTSTR